MNGSSRPIDWRAVPTGLRVDESPTGAGRGVFATVPFEEGDVIEHCPVLLADGDQGAALEVGAEGYVFRWGATATALALGYGSLYNHSYDPNATTLETDDELIISATRSIAVGDEIFINYMGTDQEGVWFDVLEPD